MRPPTATTKPPKAQTHFSPEWGGPLFENGQKDQEQKLRELCSILRADYADRDSMEKSRIRIAGCLQAKTLGDDPAFIAMCSLKGFGPKNDYNGHRSAAMRATKDWENKVLAHAQNLAKH